MNVDGKEGDDDLLAEHYASLRGTGMPPAVAEEMVQREPGVEEDEGEMEEMEDVRDLRVEMQPVGGGIRGKTVMGMCAW